MSVSECFSSLWQDGSDVVIRVRVRPGAKRDAIVKEHDQALRVDIKASPERGNANDALIRFFARLFSIPVAAVEIRHGHVSRNKRIVLHNCVCANIVPIIIQSMRNAETP